jgi:hypothetical protein
MIVVFNCPKCRRTLRADDYFSGKKIECRTCSTISFVPGAPPVRDGNDEEVHAGAATRVAVEPSQEEESTYSPAQKDSFIGADSNSHADNSYGLASLYLAAFSFLLFFSPVLLAGMTGVIGASIAFFAGLFVNTGCFTFCWHGYKLAKKAEELPGGQGYAAAGKMVNKFFMQFYALAFVFFLVGGIIAYRYAKPYTDQLQNSLKVLEQVKGMTGQ